MGKARGVEGRHFSPSLAPFFHVFCVFVSEEEEEEEEELDSLTEGRNAPERE